MSTVAEVLKRTAHRPFPIPEAPWVMQQSWAKLLFAHWPVDVDAIREHIPNGLEVDTYDGTAWIGVVPFAMRKVYPRYTVEVPWMSNFLELNVRTYVIKDGIPGVYFFSLDCSNPVAVSIARGLFHLPYFNASMTMASSVTDPYVSYKSSRRRSRALFDATYHPVGDVFCSAAGSLEHFLTERYCLYTTDTNGHCYRGVIHHDKWPLQRAEAAFRSNDLVQSLPGISLPDSEPHLLYSENIDTVEWALVRIAQP